MSASHQRSVHHLPLDAPMMRAAGERLLDLWMPDGDGQGLIVLTATRRSGRILLGELAEQARQHGLALAPPTIATADDLARVLGLLDRPAAPGMALVRSVEHGLQAVGASIRRRLVPSGLADEYPEAYAPAFEGVLTDLARGGLRAQDMAHRSELDATMGEPEIWQALAQVQAASEAWLAQHGLAHPWLALVDAQERGIEPRPVVTIGVWLLAPVARRIVAGCPGEAMVQIAHKHVEALDAMGCVRSDYRTHIDLGGTDVRFAGDLREQAEVALALVGKHGAGRFVDEIAVGVCNEDLSPILVRVGEDASRVGVRPARGMALARSRPGMLLAIVRDLVRQRAFTTIADMLRHPDVERALGPELQERYPGEVIATLHKYCVEYLPGTLDEALRTRNMRERVLIERARVRVRSLAGELLDSRRADAGTWRDAMLTLLRRVYEAYEANPEDSGDRLLCASLEAVAGVLEELGTLGDEQLTASEAIDLVMRELTTRRLAPEPEGEAIEGVGWLELASDPARIVVLAGFNEGRVPARRGTPILLSDAAREALGLETDRHRETRDLLMLDTLVRTREHVSIVVGRRDANGNPLTPSKLLFQTMQWRAIARAWVERQASGLRLARTRPIAQVSAFGPHPIIERAAPERVRVTALRDYLTSPYLFYLRHVLRLEEAQPLPHELDRGRIGTLLHETLARLSAGEIVDCDDPKTLRTYLLDAHATLVRRKFGEHLLPIVQIQLEYQRRLLERVADWQSRHRREGWRIAHTECDGSEHVIVCEAGELAVSGRIDRIDFHESRRTACIMDYKSGSGKTDPDGSHRQRNGTWRDLQLPMYRHLARDLVEGREVELAYVSLRPGENKLDEHIAGWSEDDLASADDAARACAQGILSGEYENLERIGDAYERTLRWIAGHGLLDRSAEAGA